MNVKAIIIMLLALVTMTGQAQTKDSLQLFVQVGDSCMQLHES